MKAISIRQPWAWAICHAGKRIENRVWKGAPSYRGPLLIHAAKGCTRDEYEEAGRWMNARGLCSWPRWSDRGPVRLPALADLSRGFIVARANLVDVILPGGACDSPWYMGALGLALADVEVLPEPISYSGALGLFDVPEGVVSR